MESDVDLILPPDRTKAGWHWLKKQPGLPRATIQLFWDVQEGGRWMLGASEISQAWLIEWGWVYGRSMLPPYLDDLERDAARLDFLERQAKLFPEDDQGEAATYLEFIHRLPLTPEEETPKAPLPLRAAIDAEMAKEKAREAER